MRHTSIIWVKNIFKSVLVISFLFSSMAIFAKSSVDPVGQVVFSFGEASVVRGSGVKRSLQRKTLIYEGDTITTSDRGKIGLKMVDGAIEKISANSQLFITKYRYDPNKPEDSIIKMELTKGTLFSKTGKGGKASKDKYRLNTPIAAIGIRGTEYTVYTNQRNTRVSVHSGGVVMSSFNSGCSKSGFASCTGKDVMVLMAEQKEKILLLKLGQQRPVLVSSDSVQDNNTNNPPKSSDKEGEKIQSDKAEKKTLPKVTWGRWGEGMANGVSLEEQLANGYELVSKSGDFAIIRRENEALVIPDEGIYHFTPKNYGVIVRNSANDTYKNAVVEDPSLSIDFSQKMFKTGFTLLSDDLKSTVNARGALDNTGVFVDDGSYADTNIKGAVAGENIGEAAYTFFHKIDVDNSAAGAINWSSTSGK